MKQHLASHAQTAPEDSPWSVRQRIAMLLWDCVWALLCAWTPKPANPWRLLVLRAFGATIIGKPFVHQRARIQIPWNLTLRHRAALGDRANCYTLGRIDIGEGATIAQEAYLCTGTHDFASAAMNLLTGPITVEPNVFVAARAFVMPGLTLGANAVVGACAVVTKDVAPGTIVAGNPARRVGRRAIGD